MEVENKPDFILIRNSPDLLGTIASIDSIMRIYSSHVAAATRPYKITIQYKYTAGNASEMQRTQLGFGTEKERDLIHNQLIETLDPLKHDDKSDLDSIM